MYRETQCIGTPLYPAYCNESMCGWSYNVNTLCTLCTCPSGYEKILTGEDQLRSDYYSCYKSMPPGPRCGNGKVESGEICDDGNTVNDAGNCYSDCSKTNKFDVYSELLTCLNEDDGHIQSVYGAYPDAQTADKLCENREFTKAAKYLTHRQSDTTSSKTGRWDGTRWVCTEITGYQEIQYLYCT